MAVQVVKKSEDHAKALIAKDKLDTESSWSFTAADGNALLGSDLDDWERYGLFHLAKDTDNTVETKAYYKYPYGKGSKVYMSALRAIRSRSAQQEHISVFNAAGRLFTLAKDKEETRQMKIDGKEVEYRHFQPVLDIRTDKIDEWMFEGYAVTWGSVDDYNSTFRKGAFKKTISERGNRIKVLWNHNIDEPIGKIIEIREDDKGLFVRGLLTRGVSKAEDVYKNLKAKVIDTLSFGFNALQSASPQNGIRDITEVKLYEISPVTFEANETAIILDVRKKEEEREKKKEEEARVKLVEEKRAEEFAESLENITTYSAGYQIFEALYDTVSDIWWSDDEKDGVISKLDTAVSEFHAAYLKWASDYISRFWEFRKAGIAGATKGNGLAKVFISEMEDSLETVSSNTSFTIDELKTLSKGKILPKESRNKLVELPELVRSAHQKERSKVVETLCDELRVGGFSEAEKIRFSALLRLQDVKEPVSAISELIKIRKNIKE